eukprot:CAMPEP_0206007206 /NCGR_PEP_ID=MMETSP1464-20131121/5629_1 /ASSEMBLY_ACC=CAM_ASM_001124 /TAXON_ID=119497 /ORGANISM="Exanthemachrysis gayraliae, Strain RCC1523" /LENGTH=111 /DNA_ID=CAMNT_0053380697 /DNA_START=30 /DNA_END=365 /DNA_ORIENTATION=+
MSWSWLEYSPSLWTIGASTNALVHVLMYYYFLKCTLGQPPTWKRRVTQVQIAQFVLSFLCFAATAYLMFVSGRECAGTRPMLATAAFNATNLHQFVWIARKSAAGAKPHVA